MQLVFDIEANGLRDKADTIWCIVTKDISQPQKSDEDGKSGEMIWTVNSKESLNQFLTTRLGSAERLIGHNIINYDLALLKRLTGWTPSENTKIIDTLVMSRLFNPDRRRPSNYTGKGGPHSLEAWGYRVGRGKVDHSDWSVYSPAMLRRCREDVEINALVYTSLLQEAIGHKGWKEALEIEHEVSRIITKQEDNGVNFDNTYANSLISDLSLRLSGIDDRLLPSLPKQLKVPYKTSIKDPFKKNGDYRDSVIKWFDDPRIVGGPFTRIYIDRLNLGSIAQVKDYLLEHGWKPTQWNIDKDGNKSSAKLTEDSFDTITGDFGQAIKERTLIRHRKSQLEGWVSSVRQDGRITAGANTCGTNTGRFRHFGVVNVPKADGIVYLGKEMRSLFICSPGRQLVGHDASGLELRMLAHYMNDPAYTWELLHGDIHTANQEAAGLPTRDDAKTFIYAFLYGAGDEKIGSIIGGTARDGKELKRRFLSETPALGKLIKSVKRASNKGWLKGLDGRKIWMRRNSRDNGVMQHKALNTLLQSAGAVIMKKSLITLDYECRSKNVDSWKVIDMHDEAQADVMKKDVNRYMELAVDSIVKAGEHFKLKCPLAATAKAGNNWSETH